MLFVFFKVCAVYRVKHRAIKIVLKCLQHFKVLMKLSNGYQLRVLLTTSMKATILNVSSVSTTTCYPWTSTTWHILISLLLTKQ